MEKEGIVTNHKYQRQHDTVQKEKIIISVPFPVFFPDMQTKPKHAENNPVVLGSHGKADTDCKQRIPEVNRPLFVPVLKDQTAKQHNHIGHSIHERIWPRIKQIGIAIEGKQGKEKSQIAKLTASRHNLYAEINEDIRQNCRTADHITQKNHGIRSRQKLAQNTHADHRIVKRKMGIAEKIKHVNVARVQMLI